MKNTDLTNATPQMALILAAGLGSRLRPHTQTPKPLTKVLGLTLAERVICTLLGAGIWRFLVTLGSEAETVRGHFSEIARRRGATIDFVVAEDWERGNGQGYTSWVSRRGDTLSKCRAYWDGAVIEINILQCVRVEGEYALAT